jgi:galactokinase
MLGAVSDAFHATTGYRAEWGWFVPGRVEIFGKHTDYAGGASLVAAVSHGFAVAAGPRDDEIVRVVDAATSHDVELDPRDDRRPFAGWHNYIAVVARRLARDFPGARLGADIVFRSNLPRAAGVSSSTALVVGIASALVRRGRLAGRPDWRAAIAGPLDLAGYLGAVESGLTFGPFAGTEGVGIQGGSEDHTAILASRAGHVSAYAYVPVRQLAIEPMPAEWRFVIVSSGVHAAKAGGARDQYNRASNDTRTLVRIGAHLTNGPVESLADLLSAAPDAEVRLRDALARSSADPLERVRLERRLDHFLREHARVLPAARAFRDADADALGSLSRASQEDADVLLGNQVDETRRLAALANECGAFAASSFGAGFGGSVWALVTADEAPALLERWTHRYLEAFPRRRNVEGFITTPQAGVSEWAP